MNVMVMNLGLIWLVLLIRPPEHHHSKTIPTVYPQQTLKHLKGLNWSVVSAHFRV